MTAGGLPTIQVLLDDGTGTFPYDITTYVRLASGYSLSRGRQDEISSVSPGQLSITLDNTDGRFTLGSTLIASPSPIVTDRMIRVKETANATVFTRFTGYVQAWPVSFPTGGDEFALVQITATDAQARAERQPLLSVIEQEFAEDSPSFLYVFNEPSTATSASDSAGNQAPILSQAGSGSAVVFGTATGPGTDGYTAAQFNGGKYLLPNTVSTVIQNCVVHEFFFSVAAAPGTRSGIAPYFPTWGSSTNAVVGALEVFVVAMEPTGQLLFWSNPTTGSYADGLVHHVLFNYTTGDYYIDGVFVATAFGTPAVYPNIPVMTGSLAYLAGYPSASQPSSTRVAAHYAAGSTGFAGESGTARLTRTAGYANLPVGTLDTSLTNVAFEDITGHSVAAELQAVADAEFGLVFVDGTGSLTFHNRNRAVAKAAPDITVDANLLAEDTSFQYDNQGVLNYFEVTAAGTSVTQVVRATASEATHGRYTGSATYLVQTDAEALDRGNWIVAAHDEPNVRAGTLKFDLLTATAAQQAAFLGAEANTWIRVTGLPAQTPGGTTADLIVQGFTEGTALTDWTLTFNVSARALYAAWILGDSTYSVLGSTTTLYV